jgi:enoyl-[acyl-carrier-protein] reductase (NADH)
MVKEHGVTYKKQQIETLFDITLKLVSSPEDIANTALFLASDMVRTVTEPSISGDASHGMLG